MRRFLFYVSGHGFGHATRVAAVLSALGPRARVHVRTQAPHWLFAPGAAGLPPPSPSSGARGAADGAADAGRVECSEEIVDVGMLQKGPLDVDLPRSLAAHLEFLARWDEALEREAAFIRGLGPDAVLADVPALAFAAARRAGVPSFGMSNFSWDEVLAPYAETDARWRPVVDLYRSAFAEADGLFRLPLHGPSAAFRNILDVALVARRSAATREEARRGIGIAPSERRPVVLVSLGGIHDGAWRFDAPDDLSEFLFVAFGPKPERLKAGWIELPRRTPVPHVDLLRGADAIVGKPGYGTFAEALAHRTRMLYVPRDDYPETRWLVEGMTRLGTARRVKRSDLFAGRWRAPLRALLAAPPRWADIPLDGAEAVAAGLLAR